MLGILAMMKRAFQTSFMITIVLFGVSCESATESKIRHIQGIAQGAGLGAQALASFSASLKAKPERFFELLDKILAQAEADPWLLVRADKARAIPADYEPKDLVSLDGTSVVVSRPGHRVRLPAYQALAAAAAAAKAEGVTLLVSSAYRSYAYQESLFARNVAELGRQEAERVSARPGTSQHQLGTAVDFGSITDAFAGTAAGRWMGANAGRFGFSLSYPQGYEALTGYVWESWHYRYIGIEASAMQNEYFGGLQYNLLLFLDAYRATIAVTPKK
ncbi:MAG: peptidase M15B and M15C DD-carboxypeptidase VanY/endolysin [Spirochaetes bacterium]|nr:MAG: peptidase M15B and M15C DD-carboxypeptidase VanY/endolysin [Spirochaetota bacterium]